MSGGPAPLHPIPYPAWLGPSGARAKPRGPRGGAPSGPGAVPTGPEHVMPAPLVAGLAKAWAESFPRGQAQEQGGILVRHKETGAVEWKPGPPVPVTAGGGSFFRPNYGDLEDGEELLATAHTHPYTKAQGGMVGMPFSEGDLSSFVKDPEPMQYVRSGETVFMVARTAAFDALAAKARADDPNKLKADMENAYHRAYEKAAKQGGLRMQELCEAGVIAVAKKFGLEFFKGKGDTLRRVSPP